MAGSGKLPAMTKMFAVLSVLGVSFGLGGLAIGDGVIAGFAFAVAFVGFVCAVADE